MGRAALILVLGFGVSFGTIKNNFNRQAQTVVDNYVAEYERLAARNAANCAVAIARRQLIQDNAWRPAFLDEEEYATPGYVAQPVFTPVFSVMSGSGAYRLNYQDRSIDTTLARDLVRLTARTRFGDHEHETRVILRRRYVMPPVPAAVFIDAPATFNFDGNTFMIDGHDTRVGGGPGTGETLPGIGVIDGGSRAKALSALSPKGPDQRDNVDGQGGAPSVSKLDVEFDFAEIVDRLDRYADRRLPDGAVAGGTLEWGTIDNPQITVAEGDIHLTGSGYGAGVLLIKGNLTMTGNFEWHGPVIVVGEDITIAVDAMGTPKIYGALMIQAESVHFDVRGNIGMYYSEEALQGNEGRLNLHDFSIVSWWE